MKRWSLRNRLLLLSMLPLSLSIIVLGAYFLKTNIETLRQNAHDQGRLIARQLAPATEYGIVSGNTKSLEKLARNALNNSGVIRVTVLNKENETLVETHKHHSKQPAYRVFFDYLFELFSGNNTTNVFHFPVQSEVIPLYDHLSVPESAQNQVIGQVEVEVSFSNSAFQQVLVALSAFGFGTVIILLVYVFTSIISRQISGSIAQLANTVERIQDGNLAARANIDDEQELGALASGINVMAEHISESERYLMREVEKATNELKQKNEELIEAQREAVMASHAKSTFLANMSHEIRTPLNGIIGFLDILQRTPLEGPQEHYVSTALVASRNLVRLLNGILDFSRIESGKMPLKVSDVDIDDLLSEVYDLHAPAAFEKRVELLFFPSVHLPASMMVDGSMLKQVLNNLISNAIKFTQHGVIQLHLDYDHDKERLIARVQDTGVGIPNEVIDTIFDEFKQGDNSTARAHGGSGLGLAITRSLVELHGGEIAVSNPTEGGARFDFTIQAREHRPPPPPRRDIQLALSGKDALAVESFRLILQRYGYQVLTANPAEQPSEKPLKHLQLINPLELEYRFRGDNDRIALVSSMDPAKLTTCVAWGFQKAFSKTCSRSMLNAIILDKPLYQDNQDGDTPPVTASGLHVLVVDDNHINLTLMDNLFSELGADVLMADNGDTAVEAAKTNHLDLVFLDIHMPVMDGFETARQLRQLSQGHRLHLVGLSADGADSARNEAYKAGMDDYMLKPITRTQLLEVISKYTQQAQPLTSCEVQPDKNTPKKTGRAKASGKEHLIRELRTMLKKSLPGWLEEVEEAEKAGDTEQLFQVAHKIYGACIYCDCPELADASKNLEIAAKDHVGRYSPFIQDLKRAVNRVIAELDQ